MLLAITVATSYINLEFIFIAVLFPFSFADLGQAYASSYKSLGLNAAGIICIFMMVTQSMRH